MFTLNLKEVELVPRIEEDKSFQNADEIDLEKEALTYIMEKYPDHKNPITISRKIREAIRNEQGQNQEDKTVAYMAESDKQAEKYLVNRKKAEEESNKEFEPKRDELNAWQQKERDRVHDEYQTKIDAAKSSEEEKGLEEKRQLKLDDISYEFDQKFDALMKEWNARTNELKDKYE